MFSSHTYQLPAFHKLRKTSITLITKKHNPPVLFPLLAGAGENTSINRVKIKPSELH